jgi:hypothetical protein
MHKHLRSHKARDSEAVALLHQVQLLLLLLCHIPPRADLFLPMVAKTVNKPPHETTTAAAAFVSLSPPVVLSASLPKGRLHMMVVC